MAASTATARRAAVRDPGHEWSGGMLTEIGLVAWRSLKKLLRTPVLLFFSLAMPLIWLIMFSQTFGSVFASATDVLGRPLPYDYVAVLLPGIAVMTAIQSASQAGFGMVADLESGFMDKFFVAPIRRSSVLVGKLVADGIRMLAQAGIILGVAAILTVFGWRIPFATGALGAVLIMILSAAFGVAFAGLSNTVALRTRNTETTMMVSFSLTFPLLFLSTAMLPKALLPSWVQTFSMVNPVSYVADAARSLILTGYDGTAILNAFLAVAAFGIILNGFAVASFRAQGGDRLRSAFTKDTSVARPSGRRSRVVAAVLFLVLGVPLGLMGALVALASAGYTVSGLSGLWVSWPPDAVKVAVGAVAFIATLAYLVVRTRQSSKVVAPTKEANEPFADLPPPLDAADGGVDVAVHDLEAALVQAENPDP